MYFTNFILTFFKKYFILSIAIPLLSWGQSPQKKIIEIENLLDSAYNNIYQIKLNESLKHSQKAIKLSEQKKYKPGLAWGHFYYAHSLEGLHIYEQALEHLNQAQMFNKQLKDTFLSFEISRLKMRIYSSSNLNSLALDESEKAIQHISKTKKTTEEKQLLKVLINENKAMIYRSLKKYDSVLLYLEENKSILQNIYSPTTLPHVVNNYSELADYHILTANYSLAKETLRQAIQIANSNHYPYLSYSYRLYGDVMLYEKNYDSSLFYYTKAIENYKLTKLKNEEPPIYEMMAKVHSALGNHELEKKFKIRALEIKDSLNSELLLASDLAVKTILENQNNQHLEKKTRHLFVNAIILGLIILLIFSLWYLYRKNTNKIRSIQEQFKHSQRILLQEIELKHIEETKKLEEKINESFDEVVLLAKNNNPEFIVRFQEVYPEFIEALKQKDNKLRTSEITLCAYFFLGFSTKEIAIYTYKSINTIRNRRQSIRTKLEIPPDEDLQLWFQNLIQKQS